MGYYEPRWSAEEQTMVDLMELAGYRVSADINKEYTVVHLDLTHIRKSLSFKADTEYEAIRKCFTTWSEHHA
jgi:hypothetical protein